MTAEKESSEMNNLNISATAKDETPKKGATCCSLKTFLVALCFSYFAKAFSGSYVKSSITQIERRFDISSTTVGIVDGSFEFGNLLMIAFVSYFGATLHRPRIIAGGCFVMAFGSFLSAMPHFFMGPYEYEAVRDQMTPSSNSTGSAYSISPCLSNRTATDDIAAGCVQASGSYMWVYVMIGNMLRGVGETPITPLGIAYIDDFADPGSTPLYIACLQTVAMFGPMAGFTLGSLFAKLYVDIGFVDLETVSISPQDTRWVGAWWLGFLASGAFSLIAGIPFCFLPKRMKMKEAPPSPEGQKTKEAEHHRKATMKGFFLSVKSLVSNPLYAILMLMTFLQMNSFLGYITYKPKYMEQQFQQSITRSNFITGVTTLPAAALGMFLGGLLMKKYRFGLLSTSKLVYVTSSLASILGLSAFMLGCENSNVAGITVSYNGNKLDMLGNNDFYSTCNAGCGCSAQQWDPVCGANNITYMSACLAGCKSSTGSGKNVLYQNCSCIDSMYSGGSSASPGSCPPSDRCSRMFILYVISQAVITFIFVLGGSASVVIVLWCVPPELKSLAVGIYMLLIRISAGIPAPIYFGALIDRTCLKWGTRSCGGRGACRLYDTHSFRNTFLGLTAGIRAPCLIIFLCFIFMVRKKFPVKKENEQEEDTKKSAQPEDGGKGAHNVPEIERQTFI